MELSSLVFSATTTELERASTVIASLVQDMSRVSVASANMARIQAQTEAILARAATESAKARKENARAADIEIKTIIAADKADADRAESIRKAAEAERRRTEATEESTRAGQRNVSILQRQSDILEFQAQGWSKGQSSILATAKAANIAADEMEKLQKVLETQRKLMGSDPFDKSMSGLTSLKNQYGELRESIRQYNTDSDLTSKQTKELARDKERLIEKMKTESASFSEIRAAVRAHNDEYIKLAGQYNNLANAEANVLKNRKAVASATEYLTSADQKLSAALNTSNAAIDRSGTDLLVKYEAALRKSGVAQDVATQKLAAYKAQLVQVQGQEEQRRAQHLTRSLTPQISDVVVSLWSGQNPLTVLLQQGAQIGDLFQLSGVKAEDFAQTVRNAFTSMVPAIKTVVTGILDTMVGMFKDAGTAVVDYIGAVTGITEAYEKMKEAASEQGTLLNKFVTLLGGVGTMAASVAAVGIFLVVAALVGLAIGLKQVIEEEDKLALTLASSGGSLNLSHGAAIEYAKSMRDVGISTGEAIEVITAMAAAGNFLAKEISMVVVSATEMEKYAGVAVEDTVKQFSKLKEKPVEAILELAKSTGMIAPEVVKAVIELERQGKTADAVALAMTTLSSVNTEKVKRMKEDFSGLSLALIALKDAFSGFFAGVFKSLFYKENPVTKLTEDALQMHQSILAIESVNPNDRRLGDRKKLLETMKAELATALQSAAAESNKTTANIAGAKAEAETEAMRAKFQGVVAKSKGEIVKLEAQRAKWEKDGLLTDERRLLIAQGIKDENKKIADELKKDAPKGDKKLDSFYDDAMKKFRDATIEANDATNELTKSQVTLMEKIADPKFAKLSEQKKLDILQSGAAAIAKEKEKEATIALQKAEDFREKVLGKSQGLGKQYYADIEALHKHAEAAKWSTEQIDEQIQMIFKGTPVYQNYQKTIDRMTEALRKFSEESITYRASTNSENQELNHRISLLGKTAEEQRKIQIEYQREIKLNETKYDLEKKLRDIAKERKEAEGKGVVDLQKFADAEVQARQDAADRIKVINKSVAVEYASDLDKEIAAVKRGISDSIVSALFEGGKEGSKQLRNVLVDTLRKKVTIVVDAVVNTLVGNVIGSITGGAAGAAGASTGSSLLGMAGNASALYSAGTGLYAGFASAASQATLGAAFVGPSATAAGGAVGIGANIGAALQAIPGWGWALAAVVAIAAMWDDGSGTPHQGAGAVYSKANGTKGGADLYNKTNFGMGDKAEWTDAAQVTMTELSKGLTTAFDGIAEAFGKTAGFEIATAFADDSGDDGAWGQLRISQAGKDLINWASKSSKDGIPKEFANGEEGYKEYLTAIAKDTRQVLLDMDLPSWADTILNDIGEAADMSTLSNAMKQIASIQTMFTQLGQTIGVFAGMSDKAFESLLRASGGTEVFSQNINAFYQEFYTESERLENSTKILSAEFTKAGVEMPKTREEFKALVLAQFAAGEAGAELAGKLLKLSPVFAEVVGNTTQVTEAERQLQETRDLVNIQLGALTGTTNAYIDSLALAAGGMEALSGKSSNFYNKFFSDEEKRNKTIEDARVGLSAVGLELPKTSAGVREMMNAALGLGDAGKDTVLAILNATEGMYAFITSIEGVANAAVALNTLGGVGESPFAIGGGRGGGVNPNITDPNASALDIINGWNNSVKSINSAKPKAEGSNIQTTVSGIKEEVSNMLNSGTLQSVRNRKEAVDGAITRMQDNATTALTAIANNDWRGMLEYLGVGETNRQDEWMKYASQEDKDTIIAQTHRGAVGAQGVADQFKQSEQYKFDSQTMSDADASAQAYLAAKKGELLKDFMADIESKIQELTKVEKGPLTAIKDATQLYIDDLKALDALTAETQAQVDKLTNLQLDKARKNLYDQLLSKEEIKARDKEDLVKQFKEIAKEVPATTNALREMVDAAKLVGDITLADKLLELVPAFVAIQDAVDTTASTLDTLKTATDEAYAALERAVEAQRTLLNKQLEIIQQRLGLENALLGLLGNTAEVRKRELAALDESNRAIQERIWGLQDATSATDKAYSALEKSINLQKQTTQQTIDNLKSIFDATKEAAKVLYNEVDSTKKANTSVAMQFIDYALVSARLGGNLPDSTELREAIEAVQGSIVDQEYSSAFEAERAKLVLAGKLAELRDIAEPQLTAEEKQLKVLDEILVDAKEQIDRLRGINDAVLTTSDAQMRLQSSIATETRQRESATSIIAQSDAIKQQEILKSQLKVLEDTLITARAQIDELRGINTSVLSVATAVSNLAAAIAAEKATVVKPPTSTPITGGVFPQPWKATPTSTVNSIFQELFGRDAKASGMEYYSGLMAQTPGMSVSDLTDVIRNNAQGEDLAKLSGIKLPGFDVGINNVPYDMPAYLHAGESVIPSEFNPFNPNAVSPLSLVPASSNAPVQQDNSEIIEENRLLRQELQAQNGAMVRLLSKVARVVERWDGDGLPEARTEAA